MTAGSMMTDEMFKAFQRRCTTVLYKNRDKRSPEAALAVAPAPEMGKVEQFIDVFADGFVL